MGAWVNASASHIVGGEIYYTYLGSAGSNWQYRITMNLFVDCKNGNPSSIEQDKSAFFNVFSVGTNSYSLYSYYGLSNARTGPFNVTSNNYKCIKNIPDVCVDKYTFTVDMSLPKNNLGYVVTFERCCRNSTISNIYDPGNTGATYFTTIPGSNLVNGDNAPQFKYLPPKFICINAPLTFDNSATDADGDSLVYELYTPYAGASKNNPSPSRGNATNPSNFKTITWGGGYSIYNQIDGAPTLSINRKTGKLTLTPTVTGQYVVGIKVLSYRKGVLISETRRDVQFNAINCVFEVVSAFTMSNTVCSSTPLTFQNLSQGATAYKWDFGVKSLSDDTSILKSPSYTYDSAGSYEIMLISKTSLCADTFFGDVSVKQKFAFKLPNDTLYCNQFSRTLKSGLNNKSYQWSTGAVTDSITITKAGTYWLRVSDNPCSASDTITIRQDQSKVEIGPDSVICQTSFTPFIFKGPSGYRSYSWNNGGRSDTNKIRQPGTYILQAVDNNYCTSSDTMQVILYSPPDIRLNDTLFCRKTTVVLDGHNYDQQTSAESRYLWSTGETSDKITVAQPGKYSVTVRNRYCVSSDQAVLQYIPTGLDLGPDTFFCGPVFRIVTAQAGYRSYLWQDGSSSQSIIARSPGQYKVTIVSRDGCVEDDSMTIIPYPILDPGLGHDTAICVNSQILLTAKDSMLYYHWSNGESGRTIKTSDRGLYTVTVKNSLGCIASDSIRISSDPDALPNELFMPDAFSPNDDGVNDRFPDNHYINYGSVYDLLIYNRWGEKLYESHDPSDNWDGRYKSGQSPQEVYIFFIRYIGCDGQLRQFRGTFTLLR